MNLFAKDIILLILGLLTFFLGPMIFKKSVGNRPKDPILLLKYYHDEDLQKIIPRAFGGIICFLWVLLKLKQLLFS